MHHHRNDPGASSLARGPAKCEDIERTRRALVHAEYLTARYLQETAARRQADARRRDENDPRRDARAAG